MDWPLVRIRWIDSCEPYAGWQRIRSLVAPASLECVSVGFLVDDGERTKTVAPHLTYPATEDAQGCGIMIIPAASILSIERLSVSEPGKPQSHTPSASTVTPAQTIRARTRITAARSSAHLPCEDR